LAASLFFLTDVLVTVNAKQDSLPPQLPLNNSANFVVCPSTPYLILYNRDFGITMADDEDDASDAASDAAMREAMGFSRFGSSQRPRKGAVFPPSPPGLPFHN